METDTCRVGDDCRNNNRTTQVLLEFSSCLPREEICDLQFAPSIQLTQCSVFTTKIQLLSPGSGEQGQMLLQEHEGMCVCVCVCACLFVCLFVCHWDVVKAAWLVCLFLKSPRGSFWQKAPPEQAWIRVCFGWELRRSAYEETRGEEET